MELNEDLKQHAVATGITVGIFALWDYFTKDSRQKKIMTELMKEHKNPDGSRKYKGETYEELRISQKESDLMMQKDARKSHLEVLKCDVVLNNLQLSLGMKSYGGDGLGRNADQVLEDYINQWFPAYTKEELEKDMLILKDKMYGTK